MLLDAIFSSIYGLINSFVLIIRCGTFCPYGYTYLAKIYEIYIFAYVGKSCELFILLLDINISLLRLGSFTRKNKSTSNNKMALKVVCFLIVSFLVCIPSLILPRTVDQIGYLVSNHTLEDENVTRQIFTPLYVVEK